MTQLTAEARAALQAQQAEIASQLAADQTATENERRAAEREKLEPLVGVIDGEDLAAIVAAIIQHRAGLPPKLWSATEHFLTTTKVLVDNFRLAVEASAPVINPSPVLIPAQATAPGDEG